MKKLKKKKILLSFDEGPFLEFRKHLFQNGMSVQDFFSNVITVMNNRGEDADFLLEQVKESKLDKFNNKEDDKVPEHVFYEIFEKKFDLK